MPNGIRPVNRVRPGERVFRLFVPLLDVNPIGEDGKNPGVEDIYFLKSLILGS